MKSLALASKVKSLALALKVKSLALKPQVLDNCPVLGSRTALFFEQLKFCWKTPETSQKICEHLFCIPHLEHLCSQGERAEVPSVPSPIEISPMTKCDEKAYSFFSFFLVFFAYNSITNNNIEDQGLQVPLNSIFASQF